MSGRRGPRRRSSRIPGQTAFSAAAGIVGVVSGLQATLGVFSPSGRVALAAAVLLVVIGGLLIFSVASGWLGRILEQRPMVVVASFTVSALVIGVGLGLVAGGVVGERRSGSSSAASAPPSSAGASVPSRDPSGTTNGNPAAGLTYVEIAGNRNGTPVFRDTQGSAVPSDVPASIDYLTRVRVRCKVENTSAMTSVSYWYLLADGPWRGMYAPSDTFANGDPLGTRGTHNVDANIPDC